MSKAHKNATPEGLASLRNIGKAMLADIRLLGIDSVAQLAEQEADDLYVRLCVLTGTRQDPCVHDTFAAAIHQARTGEARDWWTFSPARKARREKGDFPSVQDGAQKT
jgi:hypothetical protein